MDNIILGRGMGAEEVRGKQAIRCLRRAVVGVTGIDRIRNERKTNNQIR